MVDQPISSHEVAALRRTLDADGAFVHHPGRTLGKLAVLLAAVAALTVVAIVGPWWLAALLVPLVALPLASAAMIGHEAGHRSFARRPWHNEVVLHAVFPLLGGLSVRHWKHKHNVLHHGHPNVVGVDDDIALWPFALSAGEHDRSSRVRRWFQRNLQGALFWPLTTFLVFVMRVASVRYTVAALGRRGAGLGWAADVACQLAHYVLWLVLPAMLFGWWPALVWYVALWACVGVYLSLVFTPAHVGLPLRDGDPRGWRHQLASTRNLVLPRWLSWFFIGLDHQVEHHLFPTISHHNLGRASEPLRAFCARIDAPYQSIAYVAAVRDVTQFVTTAWRVPPAAVGMRD